MALTLCNIRFNIILPIFYLVALILMISGVWQYIKGRNSIQSKTQYRMGLILFSTQIGYILSAIITKSFNCHSYFDQINGSIYLISTGFFGFQFLMILLILFYRLFNVFKDTSFKLSHCTISTFVTFYSLLVLSVFFGCAVFTTTLRGVALAIAFFLYLSLIPMLTSLFVYKLVKINQSQFYPNTEVNMDLSNAITKLTVLAFVSVCSSLFNGAVLIAIPFMDIDLSTAGFVEAIAGFSDTLINFFCILFTFKHFGNEYHFMCYCCDRCCKLLCKQVSHRRQRDAVPAQSPPQTPSTNVEVVPESDIYTTAL